MLCAMRARKVIYASVTSAADCDSTTRQLGMIPRKKKTELPDTIKHGMTIVESNYVKLEPERFNITAPYHFLNFYK